MKEHFNLVYNYAPHIGVLLQQLSQQVDYFTGYPLLGISLKDHAALGCVTQTTKPPLTNLLIMRAKMTFSCSGFVTRRSNR